jgi:ribonuclease VapC
LIYVDASAIVAALLNEAKATEIMSVIEKRPTMITCALAIYEAGMAVARVTEASPMRSASIVKRYLERFGVMVAAIDESHGLAALDAFRLYGKPHHPAKLNMGDCFAYAVAKSRNASILFVGNDFTYTDLPDALASI